MSANLVGYETDGLSSVLERARSGASDRICALLDRAQAALVLRSNGENADALILATSQDDIAALLSFGKEARQGGDRGACLAAFKAAAELAPLDPWPCLDVADELRERGLFDDATQVYHRVLALSANNVQALRGLGYCARARGAHAEALAQFAAARDQDPDATGPLMEVADELWLLGRMAEAAATYRHLLLLCPDHRDATAGLAACGPEAQAESAAITLQQADAMRASGQLDLAEAAFRSVLETPVSSVGAHLGLAKCARARGQTKAALAYLRAAAVIDRANPWPWVDLGDVHRDEAAYEAAEDAYHQVLLRDRTVVPAWLGLAHCASQRRNPRQALALFYAAACVAPKQLEIGLDIARTLLALDHVGDAEQVFRTVLASDPGLAEAQFGLVLCARARGDDRGALAALQSVVAANPRQTSLQIELAGALRGAGLLDEAEALCRAIVDVEPSNSEPHIGLGFIARARGSHAAAQGHFAQAAALNPDNVAAALECAFDQRESGDVAAALGTAQAVLLRHPGHVRALLSIGASQRRAGRHQAARAAFQAAHEAAPRDPVPLVELAALAEELPSSEPASDTLLEQARLLDPHHPAVVMRCATRALRAQEPQAAYDLFQAAIERRPRDAGLRLGAIESLGAMGRLADALAALDALEAEQGPLPAILQSRVGLLRRDGDYLSAVRCARAASGTSHPGLFRERVWAELQLGALDEVASLIALYTAQSPAERALLDRCRAALAERSWRPTEALRHYEAAASVLPAEIGVLEDIVRVKLLLLDIEGAWATLGRYGALMAPIARLERRSTNISQTQFGQQIDEYRLDEALPLLAEIASLPQAAERARFLRHSVRHHANSSALAITLMLAMRQSGAFATRQPAAQGVIPRRLAQLRRVAGPASDLDRLAQSWDDINPGIEHSIFDTRAAATFLAERLPRPVLDAFRRVPDPAQQSDLFLLAWLTEEGGIVADPATRCLQSLDTVLSPGADLVVYQGAAGCLETDFIAARPSHPVIRAALDHAVTAINRGDNDTRWLSTGPALLTRVFARFLSGGTDGLVTAPLGAVVLDHAELSHAVATGCATLYRRAG